MDIDTFDASPRRVEVATLLRHVGHALVVCEADDDTLASLHTALASALPRMHAAPSRRLSPAAVRRSIFEAPQPAGERLEHFPDCPGCGRANPHGLAMEVSRQGEDVVGTVTLAPGFAGAPGRAHGGVVAMLIDDLMGFALRTPAYTVALTLSYSAPVPIGMPIAVRCRAVGREGRRIELEATVTAGGTVAARATATFVTVSAEHYDAI
jgi:acyl-coenzyme A thioesterase PaaI-like protein